MVLKGLIVYFDGPDGVGKTTQLQMAADKLTAAGHEVYVTHVLAGSPIGEKIFEAMMSSDPRPAETDLYAALAAEYAAIEDIESRRNSGQIVLIDRSPLSIIAYQVFAGGIESEKGYGAVTELLEKVNPDLVLTFMASASTRLARRQARNAEKGENYFEKMPPAYHEETAKGYQEAATRLGATVIDSEPAVGIVHEATMQKILAALQA
jgi:dTMP kinase